MATTKTPSRPRKAAAAKPATPRKTAAEKASAPRKASAAKPSAPRKASGAKPSAPRKTPARKAPARSAVPARSAHSAGVAALGTLAAAVLGAVAFGAWRLLRRPSEGTEPTDLMGDSHPDGSERAIEAFRPDPTAPVPAAEREQFRPALAQLGNRVS